MVYLNLTELESALKSFDAKVYEFEKMAFTPTMPPPPPMTQAP
jgi:hypothetical protein